MKIIKRNGAEVVFDIDKIMMAVTKANEAVEEKVRMTPLQIQRISQSVQIACEGVPCVVMSLPLKYMHTTVELGSLDLMRDQARLIAEAVAHMHAGWEETLCF